MRRWWRSARWTGTGWPASLANFPLGQWTADARRFYARGDMDEDRVAQLEKLGMVRGFTCRPQTSCDDRGPSWEVRGRPRPRGCPVPRAVTQDRQRPCGAWGRRGPPLRHALLHGGRSAQLVGPEQ
nr:helicase associated domain-containing protein [Streptomyces sp. Ncost-T10-10d]